LTPNFASQALEISVRMNIDANGLLEVEAEESRSGAKAKITIDPKNRKNSLIKINIFLLIYIHYRST
jgi:molecular chaperone DnaK (HSP70)